MHGRQTRLRDRHCLIVQWGNLAAVGFLLFAPHNRQLGAMVYALADGPLAAALMAWQSAWVFGSTEHSIRCVHTEHAGALICTSTPCCAK
jgi:hypothetical protein